MDVNLFFSSMLEEILDYRNVQKALKQVTSNKGAGGVDGMQTEELRVYIESNWTLLKQSILEGSYRPGAVRKVEIPKPQGGVRMLGIPTVLDRLLQQAISQWLSPKYEPEFSTHSYGFRPGRNAPGEPGPELTAGADNEDPALHRSMRRFFTLLRADASRVSGSNSAVVRTR